MYCHEETFPTMYHKNHLPFLKIYFKIDPSSGHPNLPPPPMGSKYFHRKGSPSNSLNVFFNYFRNYN